MSESFSNLLDESLSTLDMQPGSIVSGVVLDVDKDWVTVHVGLKSEGVISLDEFRNNEGTVDIEVGDEIEVALEAVEDGYGETRISREKARKISTWKMLEEALETGLVNKVYESHEEMVAGLKEMAPVIASKSPLAVYGTKAILNFSRDHTIAEGLEYNALWSGAMLPQEDMAEAMMSNMEKRDPEFKDMQEIRDYGKSSAK